MKRQLLDILACPVCRHHPLELTVEGEDDRGVKSGTLTCSQCGAVYPITDGIPDMIPPSRK